MTDFAYRVDRSVLIEAPRDLVFRFFQDPAWWASWWGEGSTIDARPGGRMLIRNPGGSEASGEVVEVTPPERIVFTYGYAGHAHVPPGASRVTIRLEPDAKGTRLHLEHALAHEATRDQHVQGWRHQLSVFANTVANRVHAGAADTVDGWFRMWNETDGARRRQALAAMAVPEVSFRDQYSLLHGLEDLASQIDAYQRFMPGMTIARRGTPRHCQGMLLVDWEATGPDGASRGAGTNVFCLAPDGRVAWVTGFWGK